MKKLLIVTGLLLCLLAVASTAYAAAPQVAAVPAPHPSYTLFDPCSLAASEISYPVYRDQYFERTITIRNQQPDGSFQEHTVIAQLVKITYKYTVEVGIPSGLIIGGNVNHNSYPQLTAIGSSDYAAAATRMMAPTAGGVTYGNGGTTYQVSIRGGYFTLTYNSVVYYDMYGNMIPSMSISTTDEIAFYFTDSGTLEDLLQ